MFLSAFTNPSTTDSQRNMQATFTVTTSASNVNATFVLTNTTDTTYYVCNYYSPLEGICNEDVVDVIDLNTNTKLRYAGVKASRQQPTHKNYVCMKPGDSLRKSFSLTCYPVRSGQYRLTCGLRNQNVRVRTDPKDEDTSLVLPLSITPIFQLCKLQTCGPQFYIYPVFLQK